MAQRLQAPALVVITICTAVASVGCNGTPTRPTESGTLKILSVMPNTVPAATETAIRIVGSGFTSGTAVTLGGTKVSATLVSGSALNAVAPPHAAGSIDVTVTNPDGQSSALVAGLTYNAPIARLTSLTIGGNTTLTSIGETSQLTVTAAFDDGSTRDVTKDTRWYVSNPAVATISPIGLISAMALGATTIGAQYPSSGPGLFRSVLLSVTPPGTFAASGRVREPGAGDLNGVLVTNAASGQSVLSVGGQFAFGGLTNGHLSFAKDGYESTELDMVPGQALDVPMQRVVRIEAASAPISTKLAPNDLDYLMAGGAHCQPCRLIRIISPTPGQLHVQLTWQGGATPLRVWAGGRIISTEAGTREAVADVLSTGGETVVFVGTERTDSPGDYIPITLSVTAGVGNPSR